MYGSVSNANLADPCPDAFAEREWYAAYTRPQHERSAAQQITAKAIEVLLPVAPSRRQWKDRVVHLEMPLFPGYVFVRMHLEERYKVLSAPSVVNLVSFNGKPAVLDAVEIDAIRECLTSGSGVQSHTYLGVGRRVRIKRGPLEGIEGVIVEQDSGYKLVVSIRLLQQALAVDVDVQNVEALTDSLPPDDARCCLPRSRSTP